MLESSSNLESLQIRSGVRKYYGLSVMSFPDVYTEALTPNMMVLEVGPLGDN